MPRVYSTDLGPVCPECNQPKNNCICRQIQKATVPVTGEKIRVRYETAGRKGKGMTLISGLPLNDTALFDLAKRFKQQFGTGGAVKEHVIELQGDHREKTLQTLHALGYPAS